MAGCTKCGRLLILSTDDGLCTGCHEEKEIERQRIDGERALSEMEAGKERIEVGGLYEPRARILECYAQKYGYKEDAMFGNSSPFKPQKFKLIFTKTSLSKVSQTLGIPQENMTIIRIDLANMATCQYCKTSFDLNQQPRCPNCGGTPVET